MNFDQSSLRRLARLGLFLIPVALFCRIITYWVELDVKTGFFFGNGLSCHVYNVLGVIVFAFCLLFSLHKGGAADESVRKKRSVPPEQPASQENDSLLVRDQEIAEVEEEFPEFFLQGVARKSAVWGGTLSALASFLPGFAFFFFFLSFLTDLEALKSPLTIVYALFSFLCALHFLVTAVRNSPEIKKSRAFFALLPVFWCTVRMIAEYRDLVRFINKPLYAASFLYLLSILFFFVYRAQFLLGEDATTRPNSYAFCALPVVFFGLTARLPFLVAMMANRVPMDLTDAAGVLIDLALCFYAFIKLRSLLRKKS